MKLPVSLGVHSLLSARTLASGIVLFAVEAALPAAAEFVLADGAEVGFRGRFETCGRGGQAGP